MTSTDLPPANGRGAEHFDVPTRFYLTHRQDIERWAALRKQASDAIHRLHLGLEDDVVAAAEHTGLTVGLFRTGSGYRSWLLARPGAALGSEGAPVAAIGIRWHRVNTVIEDDKLAARVGVRISERTVRERFLALDGGLRTIRASHGLKSDTFWPIYRQMPGSEVWWSDLDSYRQRLLDQLEQTTGLFHPHLVQL
jgi:hypothetical protein